MKTKDVTAEELHEMASTAGLNIPLEKITEKMDKLNLMSDDEKEENKEEKKQEE